MQGSGKGYNLSINMNVHMMSDIVSVSSPSHSISSQIHGRTASAGLTFGSEPMSKDLIVNIEVSAPHEPRVCLEVNESGDLAAMVTLFPHFQFQDVPAEIVFVVDRSGSMSGSRIKHARECMQLFMRSLPEDCYFNIIGFGSSFRKLFPSSKKYDDSSLRAATSHISSMGSDLGGTQLVEPLRSVFTSTPIRGYPRQVFVLTDGQVSNTAEVIKLVETNKQTNRVFSLGLGESVSHNLVEGIARAGRGTAQFVANGEEMAGKVMKQLKEAIQPALTNVKVDWGYSASASGQQPAPAPAQPSGAIVMSLLGYTSPAASAPPAPRVEVHQAPFVVPPVFDSHHFLIYALYSENKPPCTVKITAQSPDGPLVVELPVDPSKSIHGKLIHTLAARAMIRDLEEGRSWMSELGYDQNSSQVKQEIVRLGTKFQLASQHTSFIAVEERTGHHFDCWFDDFHHVHHHRHHQPVPVNVPQARASSSSSASYSLSSAAAPRSGRGGARRESDSRDRCRKKSSKKSYDSASYNSRPQQQSFGGGGYGGGPGGAPPMMGMMAGGGPPPPPAAAAAPPSMDFFAEEKKSMAYAESASFKEYEEEDEDFGAAFDDDAPAFESSVRSDLASLSPTPSSVSRPSLSSITLEQSVNGSFPLSGNVTSPLGVDVGTLKDILSNLKLSKAGGVEGEKVIATALVVAYVEKYYAEQRGVWERFIGKARKFLENQARVAGAESVPEILQAVSLLV